MPEIVTFYLLAGILIVSSALVIGQRNPMYSVLFLIVAFAALAGLYIQLDAPFVAVAQIIIYAGAIMVLFLFVIMLLDPKGEGVVGRIGAVQLALTLGAALLLMAGILRIIPVLAGSDTGAHPVPEGFGAIQDVGTALFSTYLFPFELASVLLLVAMMGALFMGKKEIVE